MLRITLPSCMEQYDEVNNVFIPASKEQTLTLEHSLVSVSKWESIWHKPFLGREQKSLEELVDYVRCMTLTQNVDKNVYSVLYSRPDIMADITAYINESMTATTFAKNNGPPNREIITSELIYYWMVSYGIPLECQKWHLSRLLTLINVCNVKNAPQKKMSQKEIFERNRAVNAARRKRTHSKG